MVLITGMLPLDAPQHLRGKQGFEGFLSPTLLLFTPRRSFSRAIMYSSRPPWPLRSLSCAQQTQCSAEEHRCGAASHILRACSSVPPSFEQAWSLACTQSSLARVLPRRQPQWYGPQLHAHESMLGLPEKPKTQP